MPRCGQLSRRANARPRRSRPITRGISSSVAFTSSLRPTRSVGIARYQKSNSIRESGVCRYFPAHALGTNRSLLQRAHHGKRRVLGFSIRGERDVLSHAEPRTTIIYNNLALLLRWFYGLRIDCPATLPAL